MAVKEWDTNYPASQDTGTNGEDQMPDLVNTQDDTRVSQLHKVRNKLHATSLKVGDNNNLPAGSLGARVTTLENATAKSRTILHNAEDELVLSAGTPGDWTDMDVYPLYVHDWNSYTRWVATAETKFSGLYAASYDFRLQLTDESGSTVHQSLTLSGLTYTSYTLALSMAVSSGVPTGVPVYARFQLRCDDNQSDVRIRFRDLTGIID